MWFIQKYTKHIPFPFSKYIDEISLSVKLHGLTNLSKATTEMVMVTPKSWMYESDSVPEQSKMKSTKPQSQLYNARAHSNESSFIGTIGVLVTLGD